MTIKLSPLNFSGLLANERLTHAAGAYIEPGKKASSYTTWHCGGCDADHDSEDDADACCTAEASSGQHDTNCPVCNSGASDHREATNCCLWKDLDVPTRYRMADAVEAGSTWAEQLNLPTRHH